MMESASKPKTSSKLEAKRIRNRDAIKQAAWYVFAHHGLDGSTVRDIVAHSGISIGTFYNYYGTREAVFQELLADLTTEIRRRSNEARGKETELEAMLQSSYRGFLEFILGIEHALDFCARNQHHIRSYLFKLSATTGIVDDLILDLQRTLPNNSFGQGELKQIATLIVANGLELLLQSRDEAEADIFTASVLLVRVLVGGIANLGSGNQN
ncbi:hypothetical protein ASD54_20630 [Rhizobium sp. Root149]|nr:hypothetical protein ASD54_20630 [Rhizobium sp. Root149]